MSESGLWDWGILLALGAYHGINPGMGWLFSVALGLQEKSRKAVWRSLLPIGTGHALAIGAVLLIAGLASAALPLTYVRLAVAIILIALGVWRLLRHRHARGFGLSVGFRDLTLWSFLMASAHGAGLMLLPVVFHMSHGNDAAMAAHAGHLAALGPRTALLVTLAHASSYLLVTGAIAVVVYEKLGLALLRKAWINLDLIWAAALIASGLLTLLLPGK